MLVQDVAMLSGDTSRSRIYLQMMERAGLCPEYVVIFGKQTSSGLGKARDAMGMKACGVELSEPIEHILSRAGVPYEWIDEKDINSSFMAEKISGLKQKYIIYSGYGGAILKPHLFKLGKKYLHIHAGLLPRYRGSTTAYYGILRESAIGATAIFLSEGIDKGDILCQEAFRLPDFPVDIDYVYEPWARAQVLVKALRQYVENRSVFKHAKQTDESAETYYIIHPVLKHLAMKKVERARKTMV